MSAAVEQEPACPKCGGKMWDNRLTKRNERAPNFKCRDKACDGVIWPPKGAKAPAGNLAPAVQQATEFVRKQAVNTLDLVEYGEPLPGKHGGPGKPLPPSGTGSSRGDASWIDELLHVYDACYFAAAQWSTDPHVQYSIANALFHVACNRRPGLQ